MNCTSTICGTSAGVMAAVAGGTTKEVMARLGHLTSGTAMRYQHVAAGRTNMLAARQSVLVVSVSGAAPAAG
jgi:hypothetical protein